MGFPTIIPSSALGKDGAVAPSERVAIGVIGCGSRSGAAIEYKQYAKSEIVAVCDPIRDRRLQKAKAWGVNDHHHYNDFRDLLAREDIDAVHIATGDHWHVPISLAAARAGKDVYCEKPLGLSIEQDLAAREIVDKHKRVFQYGTQQRSQSHMRMGLELVLNGHIGELQEIYVWAPHGASGGSGTPVIPVPEGYDLDLWTGPAEPAPFSHDRNLGQGQRKAIYHVYDYAIGFIAGWGAHPVDILQWWADESGRGIPVTYKGTGTIPTEGLFNTLTHWDVECTYADGLKMYFMDDETAKKPERKVPNMDQIGKSFGNCTMFMGSKGWIALSRGGWKFSSDELRRMAKDPGPKRLAVSRGHQRNFVDAILVREQPVSDLHSAVQSDIICQMGDICIRTGETVGWDPVKETVVGSADAVAMMHRNMRKPWSL
jgi:hypothetical protein